MSGSLIITGCAASPRLFSYCIPYDDGAAPNPFWGICTLAICKPVIRRVASVGDWVIGTGCKEIGHEQLVYAMKVTRKMSMADYDEWTRKHCPGKIPSDESAKHRKGDSIYDFQRLSGGLPSMRTGSVHTIGNQSTDLGGKAVLLSKHFYYFGRKAIPLPEGLRMLVKKGRAHKSTSITPLLPEFRKWLERVLELKVNHVYGKPSMWGEAHNCSCRVRASCAKQDEAIESKKCA